MRLLDEMYQIKREEDRLVSIAFCPEHVIYKAHFPGKPITPGVCIIKILGELLERRTRQSLSLREVKNLKFVNPISPIDDPKVDVIFQDIAQDGPEVRARGTILNSGKIYTKFSLIFRKA
ncbi:beta-hydroxyacyl-ACP dehydratase [Prevotella sp. oral taxon 376]|uniref:beta-hydroxyacyl-ACP dehydratase n=1 Tax=Prevotella sp. oral taxon 376 TaxID=712466 RepID=UPI000D1FD29A|nr:beta-hydroxyacyl-ACP dehydratase [Prevotella sp. oral taxon 376]PTL33128.1 beta-hydroxyacyl-ACP dehydratase [Prevotella sp. oral taxon 376]